MGNKMTHTPFSKETIKALKKARKAMIERFEERKKDPSIEFEERRRIAKEGYERYLDDVDAASELARRLGHARYIG